MVWWRLDSGIFHLWVVGCTCISMDMSITIRVMQTLVSMELTLEKLVGSEEVPFRKPGVGQWPVVSNGEASLCVLEVLLQDQAMLVCPFETAAVQPCGPVVCRRIPKWRVVFFYAAF